jgi:Ca-activated chloride channel homolog
MNELTFQHPELGWALAGAAVVLFFAWRVMRRRRFAAIGLPPLLAASTYRASRLRRAPVAVAAASLTATAVALMDPMLPYAETEIQSRGLDIAVVLDLSLSMEELMSGVHPQSGQTRLVVTKRVIRDFIGRRPDDRIGLILFSDNAYIVSPLTVDHENLQHYVTMVDGKALSHEGLTAIGEGITLANALLARQAGDGEPRDRAIVVFTDGENTYGRDPVEAVRDAHEAGSRVYLIGVDLEAKVKQQAEVLRLVRTVERGGGRYFAADTGGHLTAASAAIDALEEGTFASTQYVRNAPAYEPYAATAIVLLCCALLLRSLPFFVDLT